MLVGPDTLASAKPRLKMLWPLAQLSVLEEGAGARRSAETGCSGRQQARAAAQRPLPRQRTACLRGLLLQG